VKRTRLEWEVEAAETAAAFRNGAARVDQPVSFFHGWYDQRGFVALWRGFTDDLDAYNAGRLAWLIYEGMR
jgi:hypothetical protein